MAKAGYLKRFLLKKGQLFKNGHLRFFIGKMAEKQGSLHANVKHIEEYLSDEEVVQAILKIMMQSKAWQEHMRQHEGAQLHLLSTSGFQLKNEEKMVSGAVATAASQPAMNTAVRHQYQGGYAGNTSVQSSQGNFSYGSARSGPMQQEVIAGCQCGLVLDMTAQGNVHASQTTTEAKMMVSYSMMQNSYVNTGGSGYGTTGASDNTKFSY